MKIQNSARRKRGGLSFLLGCFVFFSFCGKIQNIYYLDSKLTDTKDNALNIRINDPEIDLDLEEYQFRVTKGESALIKAEISFNEWLDFENNPERIEFDTALPGHYEIILEIRKKEKTNPSKEVANLIEQTFTWERYTVEGELQTAYNENGEEIQVEGAEQIEKEGGRKVQKEEEGEADGLEAEEEVIEGDGEEAEQKTIYWVLSNQFELFVSPKEGQILSENKEYEVFLGGTSILGETANTWLPYIKGKPIDITLSSGDGNKWIFMEFREKGSEEAMDGFRYAMPIYLNPKVELAGGGSGQKIFSAPFAGTVLTGISITGCEQEYSFVQPDPNGHPCIASANASEVIVTHFFIDGQSLELKANF